MCPMCNCPQSTSLDNIPVEACKQDIGQIQKIVFQRLRDASGDLNEFDAATANPNVIASWSPLLTATDSTKVVVSPYIENPVTEPGAARTFGGDNTTLGGVPIVVGRESTAFTSVVMRAKQNIVKAMKKLQCEEIGVYFIDQYGRILMGTDDIDTITKYRPIPVNNLFVGDLGMGGLENPDMNAVNFNMFPDWSDNVVLVEPTDFNALVDLKN